MELYGYEFITDSDLAHYGILGMKWGIRRFQNKDGSLTKAGKKRQEKEEKRKAAKEAREYRNDILMKAVEYDEDFDKSKDGSKLLKKYQEQIKIMENDEDWDDNLSKQDEFYKTEISYLRAQGAYTARRLLQSDGEKGVKTLLSGGRYIDKNATKNVDELINLVGDFYVNVHSY